MLCPYSLFCFPPCCSNVFVSSPRESPERLAALSSFVCHISHAFAIHTVREAYTANREPVFRFLHCLRRNECEYAWAYTCRMHFRCLVACNILTRFLSIFCAFFVSFARLKCKRRRPKRWVVLRAFHVFSIILSSTSWMLLNLITLCCSANEKMKAVRWWS